MLNSSTETSLNSYWELQALTEAPVVFLEHIHKTVEPLGSRVGSWEVGDGLCLPLEIWGIQVSLKGQATDLVHSWVAASQTRLDIWRVPGQVLYAQSWQSWLGNLTYLPNPLVAPVLLYFSFLPGGSTYLTLPLS